MVPESPPPGRPDIEYRISQIRKDSAFAKIGLGVIVGAFLPALVRRLPSNLGSVESTVNAMLLPTIFVWMGLILFSIGIHLHTMHLNLVQQRR